MDIKVFDTNFKLLSIIDEYESFIWTSRFQDCGDFEIYTLPTPELLDLLKIDRYISVDTGNPYMDPGVYDMMIIENVKIESDAENGDHLIVGGRSLVSLLERRILWGEYNYHAADNKGIAIEKIITDILNRHIISPSNEKRKIPGFYFDDEFVELCGVKAEVSYKGVNVLEAIRELIKMGAYGFELLYKEDAIPEHRLSFYIYHGFDRSRDGTSEDFVLFSPEYDNLLNSNYSNSVTSLKNAALVGGKDPGYYYVDDATGKVLNTNTSDDDHWIVSQQLPDNVTDKKYLIENANGGENSYKMYQKSGSSWSKVGTATKTQAKRTFVDAFLNTTGEVSGINRREMFVDGSGISDQDDNGKAVSAATYRSRLTSEGKLQLGRNITTTIFDGEVDYNSMFKLYEHYWLGDIVEVADQYGNMMKARVTEIIISDDTSDGFKIYPSFTNIEEEVTE